MSNDELRPEFVEQITHLRKKIFKKIKPKMLCGRTLNGQMLVEICKAYTEAINKGSLPNIENAWTYVKKSETIKAFDKSVQKLENMIEDAQKGTVDPNKIEQLKENVNNIKIINQYNHFDNIGKIRNEESVKKECTWRRRGSVGILLTNR